MGDLGHSAGQRLVLPWPTLSLSSLLSVSVNPPLEEALGEDMVGAPPWSLWELVAKLGVGARGAVQMQQ